MNTCNSIPKLDIESLTGGEVAGSGNFDELMRAIKGHLAEEYKAGRITGDMYTQAYISSLDMALGNANTFTLQYLLTNQQVKLLDAQVANEILNKELIQAQINKINKDNQYLDKQIVKADSDIELVKSQVALTNQQKLIAEAQEEQVRKQTLKLQSEIDVLAQRKLSEQAQTSDSINGSPVGGVLGKQINLYTNQAEGYLRDAEQKAAKILNDTFLTRVTTEYDSADAVAAGQSDIDVAQVMAKLKEGIGVI